MAVRLILFLHLIIGAHCHVAALERRSDLYVKLPVVHSTNKKVFSDFGDRRAITTVPLANRSDVAYYAQLEIGTPAQQVYVQLDTGSFELWVNPDCSDLQGSADIKFCQAVGHYTPSSSSSAKQVAGTKTLRYGIGSAQIQYVADDIGLAGTNSKLKGVQFGVAVDTVDEFAGILGIGHGANVTINYNNFIDELAVQGVTGTKAFSLALGSKDEQEGVVIFGGLDKGKFTGNLQTLPIIPASQSPDKVPRYWVNMTSLSLTPPSGQNKVYENTTMAVFLDSGATLTLLPTKLANAIAADFGAETTDSNGFYPVDCSLNDLPGTLNFAFNGVMIKVPYNELVRELATGFGTQCFLGISPSDDFTLLGDTMLRSAYAVFDQTNNAIHLAPYVNCGTNEVEITPQTNMATIKGDCAAPAAKNAASTATGGSATATGSGAAKTTSPITATSGADQVTAKSAGSRNSVKWGLGLWLGVATLWGAVAVVGVF
ncbi:acid protease [Annulohypoxylon maeteangense]|uniref:acid protease n=1 Tax=Annulohypoxylon maeteangense TaxID=1927788 RepID=UPI0020084413|nr:acid protease [Annulohypoxylon maeteangense]KAI0880786.1 acid protease [Annulohypoxylon maeteangense]